MGGQVEFLMEKNRKCQEEIKRLIARIEEISDSVRSDSDKVVNDLKNNLKKTKEDLAEKQHLLSVLGEKLALLEGDKNANQGEIINLRKEMDRIQEEIIEKENNIKALESELLAVQS